jgi:hypothetical protein
MTTTSILKLSIERTKQVNSYLIIVINYAKNTIHPTNVYFGHFC